MLTVHLPASLQRDAGAASIAVAEPVRTIGELVEVLDRRVPGFRSLFDDALLNFAVNDEMVLHRVRERALADGDVVELVPTISGG
jgi:molybdopterin converting factor small subunit